MVFTTAKTCLEAILIYSQVPIYPEKLTLLCLHEKLHLAIPGTGHVSARSRYRYDIPNISVSSHDTIKKYFSECLETTKR